MRIAAIDIGTVTTRLLLAEVGYASSAESAEASTPQICELLRDVRITQLGEGLTATGHLNIAGLAAVLTALEEYVQMLQDFAVEKVRCVATSAARDAVNAGDLFAPAQALGITVEVISGSEEAQLSFGGATYERAGRGLLVVDPGGGSTEFVLGDVLGGSTEITFSHSLDIGSRRLTDRFIASDPPTPSELAAVRGHVAVQLEPILEALAGDIDAVHELIAVAGTATTMVTMKYGIKPYDRERVEGQIITYEDLELLVEALATRPLAERQRIPGLEPKRAEVITAGALILLETLKKLKQPYFIASDTDLLYGLLLNMAR